MDFIVIPLIRDDNFFFLFPHKATQILSAVSEPRGRTCVCSFIKKLLTSPHVSDSFLVYVHHIVCVCVVLRRTIVALSDMLRTTKHPLSQKQSQNFQNTLNNKNEEFCELA